MEYLFKIKKYNNREVLVINVMNTTFADFLNHFFEIDGIPFNKQLYTLIVEIKHGKKDFAHFRGMPLILK